MRIVVLINEDIEAREYNRSRRYNTGLMAEECFGPGKSAYDVKHHSDRLFIVSIEVAKYDRVEVKTMVKYLEELDYPHVVLDDDGNQRSFY